MAVWFNIDWVYNLCYYKSMKSKIVFCVIIGFLLGITGQVSAIKVRDTRPFHFVINAPKEIEISKPFKVTIIAYDKRNRRVRIYNRIGHDISITTTGAGIITPNVVPALSFKKGKAVVYFTYNSSDDFDIVATSIKAKSLKGDYLISKGDALEISVWEAEGLTKDVIVTPDGMISFPLIGEIKVEGKTLRELDNEVTEKITAYVKNPQVSVMVKKIGGRRVVVLGEVKSPGVYQITGHGTIMEVIAMAGGTTKDAITRSIAVVRGDLKTSPQVRLVSLNRVFTYGKIPREYIIQPEDIVYVPKQFIASVGQFTSALPGIGTFFKTPFFK